MILAAGEILFDRFPEYRRVGGAPLNFSWHMKHMGFDVRFITRAGDDPEGEELGKLLQRGGFEPSDLQIDPKHPTGAVNVSMDSRGVPTFEILTGAAYDYLAVDDHVRSLLAEGPDLIYYGTLMQRTENGRDFMEEVFSQAGEASRFFCDLNLRPGCYSNRTIKASLARADVLKLNEEELGIVSDVSDPGVSAGDVRRGLMEKFGISLLAVTRGERGSEIYDRKERYSIGTPEGVKVADTVGAGDAYAAILAAGYLNGLHPEKILAAASKFSGAVCQIEGALPDNDQFYNPFREMMGIERDER